VAVCHWAEAKRLSRPALPHGGVFFLKEQFAPHMAKQTKTASELEAMIMSEVRANPALAHIETVEVIGPLARPYCNWDVGVRPTGPAGGALLSIIVGRLQNLYDFAEDERALANRAARALSRLQGQSSPEAVRDLEKLRDEIVNKRASEHERAFAWRSVLALRKRIVEAPYDPAIPGLWRRAIQAANAWRDSTKS
jgi:hypothetical protein